MTDELSEPNDERYEKIAARIESFLREGERVAVHMAEGQVHVEDATLSSLERRSAALFGRLLAINEQLEWGCGLLVTALAFAGIASYAIHSRLVEPWLGIVLNDKLASWWLYVLLFVALGGFGLCLQSFLESRRFHRAKPDLLDAMESDGTDWDALIAELHRIPELTNVYRRMKLDPSPRRGNRT